MATRHTPRRGVLLLVVLSLLVLFVLVGMTFMITAGQYRRASVFTKQVERAGQAPREYMDTALRQILRDTNNSQSAAFGHSLLRDMYGSDSVVGTVNSVPTYAGGTGGPTVPGQLMSITASLGTAGRMNGRVLTFTSGGATGQSTRILRQSTTSLIVESVAGAVAMGDEFVINGIPFNGMGAGYLGVAEYYGSVTPTYNLDYPLPFSPNDPTAQEAHPAAILPNLSAYAGSIDKVWAIGTPPSAILAGDVIDKTLAGGMDESYDIADYQNMMLAWVPANLARQRQPLTGGPGLTSNELSHLIPSLHRPSIALYWIGQILRLRTGGSINIELVGDGTSPNDLYHPNNLTAVQTHFGMPGTVPTAAQELNRKILRCAMARPTALDHGVNFTGGNSGYSPLATIFGFDPIVGPWDVDNDGNGIADSVWVDLGFQPTQSRNGRLMKPLFAILCTDMDGRVNINTGGVPDANLQVDANGWSAGNYGNITNLSVLPRGDGYGPAELYLPAVLGTSAPTVVTARQGADNQPGVASLNDDYLQSPFKSLGLGNQYLRNEAMFASYYGSPADLLGRGLVMLSHRGMPIHQNGAVSLVGQPGMMEYVDDPYEINLVVSSPFDSIYRSSDLEAILRYYDSDGVTISSPLASVLTATPTTLGTITTMSFDVPVPSIRLPLPLRSQPTTLASPPPSSLFEFINAKSQLGGIGIVTSPSPAIIQTTLPFELLQGQKFDLNRPFGNGIDDDGDLIVDEPGEYASMLPADQASLLNDAGQILDTTVTPPVDPLNPFRDLYARHLYCMALLTLDSGGFIGGASNPETTRALAQWAVNVVDFRDSDSIMTRFNYDVNPFDGNGWTPAANDVVWGCERPELLITETLAWHDRRTEDTADELNGTTTQDPMNPDMEFDQRLVPRGALFVELYNPWGDEEVARKPLELYNPAGELQLDRTTPGGNPVWRLVIKAANDSQPIPEEDPNPLQANGRRVYFVPKTTLATFDSGNEVFGRLVTAPDVGGIRGGEYAVIGSAGDVITPAGEDPRYVSVMGGRSGLDLKDLGMNANLTTLVPALENTRRVELQPIVDPNDINYGKQLDPCVKSMPHAFSPTMHPIPEYRIQPAPVAADMRPVSVAVIEDLSVSVPLDQYASAGANDGTEFTTVLDLPVDIPELLVDQTYGVDPPSPQGFYIHLQRLADPTRDHDPVSNVYRTIDTMHSNLTVFNGAHDPNDPNLGVEPTVTADNIEFRSVQRGDFLPTPAHAQALWPQERVNNPQPVRAVREVDADPGQLPAPAPHHNDHLCRNSLGYLNDEYRYEHVTADNTLAAFTNFDVMGNPMLATLVGSPRSDQSNARPFPWFTWHNRPFISQYELLLVPRTSSFDLLREYTLPFDATDIANNYKSYFQGTNDADEPYRHLLNFFRAIDGSLAGGGTGLYRLFDLVHVPSRYIGTETWYNANLSDFQGGGAAEATGYRKFHNRMSKFRDPGKVNLNTMTDPSVWRAIANGSGSLSGLPFDAFANRVENSIRVGPVLAPYIMFPMPVGSGITPLAALSGANLVTPGQHLQANRPTQFPNPFRSAFGADLGMGLMFAEPPANEHVFGVNSGLLRSDLQSSLVGAQAPLFIPNAQGSSIVFQDAGRNPYFRFKPLQRLANMTTNRSSVYAVWITVGYFEVDVDGTLGKEVGSDTGQIERHRSFYLIDRSIPVGFVAGEDLNSEDAIVLQRFIE